MKRKNVSVPISLPSTTDVSSRISDWHMNRRLLGRCMRSRIPAPLLPGLDLQGHTTPFSYVLKKQSARHGRQIASILHQCGNHSSDWGQYIRFSNRLEKYFWFQDYQLMAFSFVNSMLECSMQRPLNQLHTNTDAPLIWISYLQVKFYWV